MDNLNSLRFSIILDQEGTRFQPGSEVRGRVELRGPEGGWQAAFADVVLFWRTEGRGDRAEGVAGVMNLTAGEGEHFPPVVERAFRFVLPELPWTYDGKLIRLRWYVGGYARAALPVKMEGSVEMPLIVHPRPERFEEEELLP